MLNGLKREKVWCFESAFREQFTVFNSLGPDLPKYHQDHPAWYWCTDVVWNFRLKMLKVIFPST